MSLWLTHPLLLPSLIVGVTIVLWRSSRMALLFCWRPSVTCSRLNRASAEELQDHQCTILK